MKMEAEMGGIQPQVKGSWSPRGWKGQEGPSPRAPAAQFMVTGPSSPGTLTHRGQGHVHALYGPRVPDHKGTGQPLGFISKTLSL